MRKSVVRPDKELEVVLSELVNANDKLGHLLKICVGILGGVELQLDSEHLNEEQAAEIVAHEDLAAFSRGGVKQLVDVNLQKLWIEQPQQMHLQFRKVNFGFRAIKLLLHQLSRAFSCMDKIKARIYICCLNFSKCTI